MELILTGIVCALAGAILAVSPKDIVVVHGNEKDGMTVTYDGKTYWLERAIKGEP